MRMYLSTYAPRSVTLCVAAEDVAELGWLQRMSLYERYPLEVTIVPAARAADVDRQARAKELTEAVKQRCSTIGVELVDELVAAVTHDIAQRYEAIIAERVSDEVARMKPSLERDTRDQLAEERRTLETKVRKQQLSEVEDQLKGVREFQQMLENIQAVITNSEERIADLRFDLEASLHEAQQNEWDE